MFEPSIQSIPEHDRAPHDRALVLAGESDVGDVAVGGRLGDPAQRGFQLVEAVVILLCRQIQHPVLGNQSLDHRPSGAVSPTGSAHHLGEHIEGGLRRPVAVGVETQIRIQYAHQGHIREVQSLGHHLGTDQDGDFFVFEAIQELFMGVHGADRVRIHAQHLSIGKLKFQRLLNFLGSHAQGLHGAAAFGAAVGQPLGVTAVVAHEAGVGAVEGQAVGAAGALGALAAVHADQRPGIAPAVEEEDGLVAPGEVVPHGIQQEFREGGIVAIFQLLAHVHDLDPGELPSTEAAAQLIEPVIAVFRPVHGLNAGGGGAEEHQGIFVGSPPDGDLFRRIPGGLL